MPLCSDGDLMEGVSQRSGLDRRPLAAVEPVLDLRRQPHHDRRQHRRWPISDEVGHAASRAGLARDARAPTPTIWRHCAGRIREFQNTTDKPTMIIVRSHIGYGAPHKQDTHKAHGEPLGEEEIRADQEVLRLARGRQVSGARRKCRPIMPPAWAPAGPSCEPSLAAKSSKQYAEQVSRAGRRVAADGQSASCPRVGTRICRRFRPTPKGWPAGYRRARCSMPWPSKCPG